MRNIIPAIVVFAALLLFSACVIQEDDGFVLPKERETRPQATQPGEGGFMVIPSEPTAVSTRPVKSFTMTAKRFEFAPSSVSVNVGDEVVILIHSLDVKHGFAIDEFSIDEQIDSNEKEIRFIADKPGTFSFYCNLPCGAGHSAMRGTLIVNG